MSIQPLNLGSLLAAQPVAQPVKQVNPAAPVQSVAAVSPADQSARSSAEEQQSASGSQQGSFGAEELQQALEKVQSVIGTLNNQLTFAVDQDSGRILVKIVDRETNEVIKQIPSEEILRIAKRIDTLMGLLVTQKV